MDADRLIELLHRTCFASTRAALNESQEAEIAEKQAYDVLFTEVMGRYPTIEELKRILRPDEGAKLCE